MIEMDGAPVYFERSITSYYVLLDNFAYNSQSFELDSSRAVPFRVIYVGEEDDADVAVPPDGGSPWRAGLPWPFWRRRTRCRWGTM